MSDEIGIKTARLVRMLEGEKLGGVLLNGQHNFAWITGGASNGIDLSRENGAASIFVRDDGKSFVLANDIELPRMLSEEVSAMDFEPVEFAWHDEKASGDFLVAKAKSLTVGEIATDIGTGARSIESDIAACRYELTPEEIIRYRGLGTDAGNAVRQVINKIKPGESEIEIASKMRNELAGYKIASVVTLVAADERIDKYRHPVPTENRWQKTLLLVTCAKRNGLITSLSRMICVGDAPNELQEKTEAAAFVNAMMWHSTRPGVSGAELYEIAADAYASVGFADEINRHHQGGAAGYKTREWVAHPKSLESVKANQAFAWNPSITGTKVEETVIARSDRVEAITSSSEFPVITNEIDGREFHSAGILSI